MSVRFLSIAIVGLCLLCFSSAAEAIDREAIGLNDSGKRSLDKGDNVQAIQTLEDALKLEPSYQSAKDNLAKAYNNYAITLQSDPAQALKYFHKSLILSPASAATKQNTDALIKDFLHMDPTSFADRVKLGDQARESGDIEGAICEYTAALSIKNDANIQKLLDTVKKEWDAQ